MFARVFVDFFFKNVLEGKFTAAVDTPTFLGVFDEVWRHLSGTRMAVYLTSDESRLGLFSAVAIVDTADPAKFLGELRTLARIGEGTLELSKPEARKELNVDQLIKDLGDDRYAVRNAASTCSRAAGPLRSGGSGNASSPGSRDKRAEKRASTLPRGPSSRSVVSRPIAVQRSAIAPKSSWRVTRDSSANARAAAAARG